LFKLAQLQQAEIRELLQKAGKVTPENTNTAKSKISDWDEFWL
jgi:hypothetical protein